MTMASRSALKEWAAVERVLGSGEAALLLRKGGIWERKDGFEVERRDFWIFPTFFHQNPAELHPRFAWALEPAGSGAPNPNRIPLRHHAIVEGAWRVERLDALERLEGLHTLAPAAVRSRFEYRGKPFLHVLLLRVARLPESRIIPNTLDYEGCVSWVELDEPQDTTGAEVVLPDEIRRDLRADVEERLGSDGVFPV